MGGEKLTLRGVFASLGAVKTLNRKLVDHLRTMSVAQSSCRYMQTAYMPDDWVCGHKIVQRQR